MCSLALFLQSGFWKTVQLGQCVLFEGLCWPFLTANKTEVSCLHFFPLTIFKDTSRYQSTWWPGLLDDASWCTCNHVAYMGKDWSPSAPGIFLALIFQLFWGHHLCVPYWGTRSPASGCPSLLHKLLQIGITKYLSLAAGYGGWRRALLNARELPDSNMHKHFWVLLLCCDWHYILWR